MSDHVHSNAQKAIFLAQIMSVLLIWVFVIIIAVWISNLILLSIELNDVPGATVAISIVAIPVFVTLAGVLTYVFIGLQRGKHESSTSSEED
jgi:hypothetical protein